MQFFIRYGKIISLLILAVVTILSLIPLPELPEVPGKDKTHHLLAYMSVALPISITKPKSLWVFIFGFFLWSGSIELIQPYVNRHRDLLDLAANTTGLLIGWLLAQLTRSRIKHR